MDGDLARTASAHHEAINALDEVRVSNAARLTSARRLVAETRAALAKAIADAYMEGARVNELARDARYSRETIRVILRSAGIEPD